MTEACSLQLPLCSAPFFLIPLLPVPVRSPTPPLPAVCVSHHSLSLPSYPASHRRMHSATASVCLCFPSPLSPFSFCHSAPLSLRIPAHKSSNYHKKKKVCEFPPLLPVCVPSSSTSCFVWFWLYPDFHSTSTSTPGPTLAPPLPRHNDQRRLQPHGQRSTRHKTAVDASSEATSSAVREWRQPYVRRRSTGVATADRYPPSERAGITRPLLLPRPRRLRSAASGAAAHTTTTPLIRRICLD